MIENTPNGKRPRLAHGPRASRPNFVEAHVRQKHMLEAPGPGRRMPKRSLRRAGCARSIIGRRGMMCELDSERAMQVPCTEWVAHPGPAPRGAQRLARRLRRSS